MAYMSQVYYNINSIQIPAAIHTLTESNKNKFINKYVLCCSGLHNCFIKKNPCAINYKSTTDVDALNASLFTSIFIDFLQ